MHEWLYYKIYSESSDHIDVMIKEIVAPACKLLIQHEIYPEKWFFIRYVDYTGFHLRVRFKISIQDLDQASNVLESYFSEITTCVLKMDAALHRSLIPIQQNHINKNFESAGTIELAVYEPEISKYGGIEGVVKAENIFQHSSELVLDRIEDIIVGQIDRYLLGLAIMKLKLDTLFLHEEKDELQFLRHYLFYWTGANYSAGGQQLAKKFLDLTTKKVIAIESDMTELLPIVNLTYISQVASTTEQVLNISNKSKVELLFHYIHMMNNRLGITPLEEAYLAAILINMKMNRGS
ncbi:thiopeptide-type bacteriocin biosynthesis protein [Paenibacillus sp. DS2015]|uniref:thiopeptide-type bacteriocin biosynthesis protein n=1 Tax=Paenibacillus sp. DS2015 TaxID=3373917 RepID=UPI003D23BDC3